MRLWLLVAAIVAGTGGFGWYLLTLPTAAELAQRHQAYEAALHRAEEAPIQTPTTRKSFPYLKFRLIPRAEYDVTARVLSERRYHSDFVDHFVDVSPEDLALGWGRFSDMKTSAGMRIWQEDRFFKYRYSRTLDIPRDEMISSMANTHIIPANDEVAHRLKQVGRGDLIRMTGALVDVSEPGYGMWSTSLTRTDTGAGSCEILWLESLEVIPEED